MYYLQRKPCFWNNDFHIISMDSHLIDSKWQRVVFNTWLSNTNTNKTNNKRSNKKKILTFASVSRRLDRRLHVCLGKGIIDVIRFFAVARCTSPRRPRKHEAFVIGGGRVRLCNGIVHILCFFTFARSTTTCREWKHVTPMSDVVIIYYVFCICRRHCRRCCRC